MSKTLFPMLALSVTLAACGSSDNGAVQRPANANTDVGSSSDVNSNGSGQDMPTAPEMTLVDDSPSNGAGQPDNLGTMPDSLNGQNDSATTPGEASQSVPTSIAARYEMTIINLSAGQPFSPPALLAHQAGFKLFTVGKPASEGLEQLAEAGATGALLSAANATGIVWTATTSPDGPIGPGGHSTVTLDLPEGADAAAAYLSVASMLVNTNDALTAVRGHALRGLAVGDTETIDLNSYDAGTESNDEIAAHIPGPAGGGVGYNPTRDDLIDLVLPHPGVISADDGLAGSALYSINRWNNPVGRLRIRRLQ